MINIDRHRRGVRKRTPRALQFDLPFEPCVAHLAGRTSSWERSRRADSAVDGAGCGLFDLLARRAIAGSLMLCDAHIASRFWSNWNTAHWKKVVPAEPLTASAGVCYVTPLFSVAVNRNIGFPDLSMICRAIAFKSITIAPGVEPSKTC